MGNKTIDMVKIKRILQLAACGQSLLSISKQLGLHRKTVKAYLSNAETTGKSYDELIQLKDPELQKLLFSKSYIKEPDTRYNDIENQFGYITQELNSVGVTRKLLWEEYKEINPQGYNYSQFCFHYAKYKIRHGATMYFSHEPGDKMQVDFAGKPLSIIDRSTGEIIACPVLICSLPCSGMAYVEALPSAKQEFLFNALSRCLEYFRGVTRNVLFDNMKQVVIKNHRYEYSFTDIAEQWSAHYNTNLTATRPRKPKDKPTVENGVHIAYLRVYAKLRHEEFYSLAELNKRIRELYIKHNETCFQGRMESRQDKFDTMERSCLKALPTDPFVIRHITQGKVQKNYHVILGEDKHQYSVPYKHIGQTTRIIYDENNVEIYIGMDRIAIHKRDKRPFGYTTLPEHMPPHHLKYQETQGWDAEYFKSFAKQIGENAALIFDRMLASKDLIEQTYIACLGLKRLSEKYGYERFELACKRASEVKKINYGLIKNILKNNLDKKVDNQLELFTIPKHDNIRGAEAYNQIN